MDAQIHVVWKTIIFDTRTVIMSSIIPIDLSALATNPLLVNNIVTANNSGPISLLGYNADFANVLGPNAKARLVHDAPFQPFHEAGIYNKQTNKLYVTSNWQGSLDNPINITIIDLDPAANYSYTSTRYAALAEPNGGTSWFPPGALNSSYPHHLYADEGDFTNPSGLVTVDPVTGESKKILTSFLGRNFSSVNDVRQHPHTGDIWYVKLLRSQ